MRSSHDLSTATRIRDAAVRVFARDGFARATVRAIAEEAAVSPALVIHHYGSKERLRQACDRHLLETAAREKLARLSTGGGADAAAYLTEPPDVADLLEYLTRAMREGGALADRWFDDLVEHTNQMLATLEERGALVASSDPVARTAVVVAQSLATLVFAPQIARHLGTDSLGDAAAYARLGDAVADLHVRGLFSRDPREGAGV